LLYLVFRIIRNSCTTHEQRNGKTGTISKESKMALSTHAMAHIRRYSTRVPRDPHYRLKATLATSYVVSALALPFVPPLLETRRAKADGSYMTRYVVV
jgi:hypothetical protein